MISEDLRKRLINLLEMPDPEDLPERNHSCNYPGDLDRQDEIKHQLEIAYMNYRSRDVSCVISVKDIR